MVTGIRGNQFLTLLSKIALHWMPQNTFDGKSALMPVMAWCCQAASHYLSQCWLRSILSSVITLQSLNGLVLLKAQSWSNLGAKNRTETWAVYNSPGLRGLSQETDTIRTHAIIDKAYKAHDHLKLWSRPVVCMILWLGLVWIKVCWWEINCRTNVKRKLID